MKRLAIFLLYVTPCFAQYVPTAYQKTVSASASPVLIASYATGVDNAYTIYNGGAGIPSPSLKVLPKLAFLGGNNCAVLAVHYNSAYTVSTPTDDKGETWVTGPTVTGNNTTLALYYVLADTVGTSVITIAFTGTPGASTPTDVLGGWVDEFKNTAATGSTLTLTLSAAPTSGDMALGYFLDTASGPVGTVPFVTTVSAGSGFTPISIQKSFGKLSESNTATTSTAVTTTFSGTDTILGVGIVIKQGSAGTSAPGTKYIDHYQVDEMQAVTTAQTLSFPCAGNLIVGLMNSGTQPITNITGSTGTWSLGVQNTVVGASQIVYATTPTCASSTTVTATYSTAPNSPGTALDLISVSNATSTFDTSTNTSGNQLTAANLTTSSLTPSATNEITFNVSTISWHTLTGTVADANSHTPQILSATMTKADDANNTCLTGTPASTLDEDNGFSFYINASNTTAITFIYSGTQATGSCTTKPTGAGGWSAVAAAFK